MSEIFVPIEQTKEIVCEVDMEAVFADTANAFFADAGLPIYKNYEIKGKTYRINIGNERYHVLNKQRQCACCGIHATRMFLAEFNENDQQGYNFRVFAETKNNSVEDSHLVLMTKDHIIPKSEGGSDTLENYQTLCCLCNHMKAHMGLSLEQIRSSLFVAYRIYRGTKVLNETKERLLPLRQKYERCLKTIDAIGNNISKVENPITIQTMIVKQKQAEILAQKLQKQIIEIEKKAQTTGMIYDSKN